MNDQSINRGAAARPVCIERDKPKSARTLAATDPSVAWVVAYPVLTPALYYDYTVNISTGVSDGCLKSSETGADARIARPGHCE